MPSCASRNASPTAITWSTWAASRRTKRLTTHAATDGFLSFLTAAASSLSPFSSLARASRAGVNSSSGKA